MSGEEVSRRGLFSLAWARAAAPRRPSVAAYREVVRERWEGAGPLLAALEPLWVPLCEAAGPAARVLIVAAGDGALPRAASRRAGADVTACEHAEALLAEGERRTEDLDVQWDASDPEDLPFFGNAFGAVIAGPAAAFVPRPVRMTEELLRVLETGGRLALCAPAPGSFLAEALEFALPHEGVPPPAAWGREEVARGRLDTAEPGIDVEMRELPYELRFESQDAAWSACAGPLGLPPDARDAFAALVASRSASRPEVRIDDLYTLALACRR
jgi:SAM-dependent methyltransferase